MKLAAKPIGPRLGIFLLWVAASLSAFWDSPAKGILFGIGFGLVVWTRGFLRSETPISRAADAILTGSFGVVLVTLILAFQFFHNPPLTAGLMAGFFSATIVVRWFFGDYAPDRKTTAEQGADAKPDNVVS